MPSHVLLPTSHRVTYPAMQARLNNLMLERARPGSDQAAIDAQIWELFGETWAVMFTDLAGFSRVDFLVGEPDGIHVLEVNTLPGFTPISMFPRLWQEAGLSYGELITRLVDLGIERHEEARAYA